MVAKKSFAILTAHMLFDMCNFNKQLDSRGLLSSHYCQCRRTISIIFNYVQLPFVSATILARQIFWNNYLYSTHFVALPLNLYINCLCTLDQLIEAELIITIRIVITVVGLQLSPKLVQLNLYLALQSSQPL